MEFLQALWQAVQPAALTAASALIIALIGYGLKYLKQRIAALENAALRTLITQLVQAAEQVYGADEGQAKFAYVVKRLKQRGITVSASDIEAEVYWVSKALKDILPYPVTAAPEPDNYEPTEDGV